MKHQWNEIKKEFFLTIFLRSFVPSFSFFFRFPHQDEDTLKLAHVPWLLLLLIRVKERKRFYVSADGWNTTKSLHFYLLANVYVHTKSEQKYKIK
jgi:hypothetical protein